MRIYLGVVQSILFAAAMVTAPVATADKSAARVAECKEVVRKKQEFKRIPVSAISLYKHDDGIAWTIHWDGDIANGVCIFRNKKFKSMNIKNRLRSYDKHSKSKSYRGTYGGYYFDRHIGLWRDAEGEICYTCKSSKGFPDNGG